ncbi:MULTISPECIES: DNA cytosine methyltransferase [Janthinobacterium]|uniref:Cytosine-specific methyltransferase n=1 Tax=Janthinobacterium lividum TaxID=29581 RepID=A0A5C4NSV7_9BURK|nr:MULTISPECIES: DNA cytosine methyltransferase [Janthinobacterium]MBB5610763.1 DNA (cytosine-5)-methyltransferase 1 [Janthinobacterium sp. S3T4]MBB5616249.1 DNA (cytosine-5)-methyltransferase 1 [Janthinobacterium sp. S3M3]TNC77523.1 DNA cytosine methyltransferase [Janthinobacterium lividum]
MPKAVSLFTGCGGSDAGLVTAGFEIVMANDIIPYAKDTYLANHPETDYQLCNVQKIDTFPRAELLVGCYPCQGFSQGGARQADRRINYLYLDFVRALRQVQPKAFIVENVSGMRSSTYKHLLQDQIEQFKASGPHGYNVEWKLLSADEFGVPQERKRILIVGIRSDLNMKYEFPLPTHGPRGQEPFRSIGEALHGLPDWPEGEFCEDPFHWYYMSRNRRRDWVETSKTIVSHMRHMPLHPISPVLKRIHTDCWEFETAGRARRFSYREAARLQGFSDNFIFPDTENSSLANRYKVVGNAVPPPLFHAIASNLPNIWD